MKILLITETLHAGGAETFVLRLCRKLIREGHDCDILNLNPDIENSDLLKQFGELKIIRVQLPLLKYIKKIDSLLLRSGIDFSWQFFLSKNWIRKHLIGKYDVYHTHLIKVDYLFAELKHEFPELKVIATVHGDYSDYYSKHQQGKDLRWLNFSSKLEAIISRLNKWVVISKEQEQFFEEKLRLPASKMAKFYNGFEAAVLPNRDQPIKEKFIIGMVARGVPLKGWDVLINAFQGLPQDCELRLVGTGDYLDGLREKYKDNARIVFVGFHPNPVEEINNFDVFVLPSLFPYESLPTVIIEALFCGKPVIATYVGEIPEMIKDPLTGADAGFLLDFDGKRIRVKQLYEYLLTYYHNRDLLTQHGRISRFAFDKFNMDTCYQNYFSAYQAL